MIDHPIQSREELVSEIAEAMETSGFEVQFVLDLTAGEVDIDPESPDYEGEVDRSGHNLEVISPPSSHESFEVMRDYAETWTDPAVRERLIDALAGKKPFRRFKDALADLGWLDWNDHEQAALRRFAEDWLKAVRIDFRDGGIVRLPR